MNAVSISWAYPIGPSFTTSPDTTACACGGRQRPGAALRAGNRGPVDRRPAVEADGVLLGLVVEQRLRAAAAQLLRRPRILVRAQSLEAHQGYAVAARVGDPFDLH